MAVYVDDANIPAEVRNGARTHRSTWCHLTADTPEELHDFAARLGLQRSHFQPGQSTGGKPSPFWHYDLTAGKRLQAVQLGATEISYRDMPALMRARHAAPAERPATQRGPAARHSWEKGQGHSRKCRNCELEAVARPLAVGSRWLTTYRKGERTVVAERVPPCGSELPPAANPGQLRQLADVADYHAGKAWRAGDLEEASRLLADARALDPSRADLWAQHERRIRASAPKPERSANRVWLGRFTGQTARCGTCSSDFIRPAGDTAATTCLRCQTAAALQDAGIQADDPGLVRGREWNRSVLGPGRHLDPPARAVLEHQLGQVELVHQPQPTEEKEAL